jgi:hypothetical protein
VTARRTALAVFWATVGLNAAALALLATSWSAPVEPAWGFRGYAIVLAFGGAIVGLVVSVRVPGNRVGRIVAAAGLLSSIQAVLDEYTIRSLMVAGSTLPGASLAAWLNAWVWVLAVGVAGIALPLSFPTGRLALASERRIGRFAVVAVVITSIGLAIAPGSAASTPALRNPFQLPFDSATLDLINGLAYPPIGVAAALSAVAVMRRFRRSEGEVRQQLKWFAFAMVGVGLALGFGVGLGPSLVPSLRIASSLVVIGSFIGLIAAVGVAVLRYRLYDIDRIVSRTISYAAVTAALVGAYIGAVLLLQDPLGALTAGETMPVALSTLVVAALFNPLRRRVQAIVDRRFNRARFDAERTTAAFGDRLRDQVDLPMLAEDLDATVRQAIAPSRIGLWLRGTGR